MESQNENSNQEGTNLESSPQSLIKKKLHSPLQVKVFKGDPEKFTKFEWVTIFISILVIVFNIFTLIYVKDQTLITADAVKIAKEQFNYQRRIDSLNAISQNEKDSLFIVDQHNRDSVNLASFKSENRAYMNLSDISDLNLRVNEPILYRIFFTNSGKTPAYNFKTVARWKIGSKIEPSDFAIVKRRLLQSAENVVISGHIQPAQFGVDRNLVPLVFSELDSTLVFNRTKTLFIFGIITYSDIFKEQHYSKFSFMYDITLRKFYASGNYNESD